MSATRLPLKQLRIQLCFGTPHWITDKNECTHRPIPNLHTRKKTTEKHEWTMTMSATWILLNSFEFSFVSNSHSERQIQWTVDAHRPIPPFAHTHKKKHAQMNNEYVFHLAPFKTAMNSALFKPLAVIEEHKSNYEYTHWPMSPICTKTNTVPEQWYGGTRITSAWSQHVNTYLLPFIHTFAFFFFFDGAQHGTI